MCVFVQYILFYVVINFFVVAINVHCFEFSYIYMFNFKFYLFYMLH